MEFDPKRNVDVISLFDDFYEHYSSICSELACKEESLKMAIVQRNNLSETNNKLLDEHSTLQATVNECQAHLQILCDLQEEIRVLKKDVLKKEEVYEEEAKRWKKSIQDMHDNMTASLDEQRKTLSCKHQIEVEKLHEIIHNLEERKANLEQQVQNINKEKTREINSLTMSYESKLSKANRQKAQFKQQQQMVVSQNTLRKKMQHMKENFDRETTSLISRITELEQANVMLHQQRTDKMSYLLVKP